MDWSYIIENFVNMYIHSGKDDYFNILIKPMYHVLGLIVASKANIEG